LIIKRLLSDSSGSDFYQLFSGGREKGFLEFFSGEGEQSLLLGESFGELIPFFWES